MKQTKASQGVGVHGQLAGGARGSARERGRRAMKAKMAAGFTASTGELVLANPALFVKVLIVPIGRPRRGKKRGAR